MIQSHTSFDIEGNFQLNRPMFRVMALASLIALAGCHRQADAPGEAPTGLEVAPGEGLVTVRWIQEPGLTYWIFFQAGSTVAPGDLGAPLIFDVQSPRVVAGLTNGVQYAFVMNATNKDSPGGPSTPVVTGVPRLAGSTWTSGAPIGTPPQNLNGVVFGAANRIVAVGDSVTLLAADLNYTSTTPPGVTAWTQATSIPAGFASDLSAVTFDGSQFIALGTDGSIVKSTDGNAWTAAASIPNGGARMNSLAFGFVPSGPTYVAVGDGGNIFTSPDLVTWTAATSPTGDALYNVSFPKDSFVATGANGTLLTSADAVTWVAQNSGTSMALRGSTYGTNPAGVSYYVVVGDSGTIVTSTDGTSWSVTTLPGFPNLRAIRFGTRFVAVGQGAIAYSDDAINWSVPGFPPGSPAPDLASVIFTPAMYLAVGPAGANAVSR
jgi:hypothetical protein